jgi:hypothetical protein
MMRPEHAHEQDSQRNAEQSSRDVRADPEAAPERLASTIGNRAFSGLVTEPGRGVLPDGRVDASVEASIASTRGSGASLDSNAQGRFGSGLGDSLADVRVHTDATADALARSVDARAFATGSDVYFARGEYRPGSQDGDRLLAHELAHVVQQRGAPTSGPLVVSQPGDALETEADAVANELAD